MADPVGLVHERIDGVASTTPVLSQLPEKLMRVVECVEEALPGHPVATDARQYATKVLVQRLNK